LIVASFLYTVCVYWLLGIFSIIVLGLMKIFEDTKDDK
jgi:hypothetical protein